MRILLANHTPIIGSGSGTYTISCAKYLRRHGHDVSVFVVGPKDADYLFEDIEVKERKPPLNRASRQAFPSFTGHPLSSLCYGSLSVSEIEDYRSFLKRTLKSISSDFKADVIHSQHVFELTAAALATGIPTVATSHGSELEFSLKQNSFSPWHGRVDQVARKTRQIIVVSKFVGGLLRSCLSTIREFHVIPCGYDDGIFYPANNASCGRPKTILMAGRFVSYKRFELGIQAYQNYLPKSDLNGLDLVLCGEGPQRAYYESLILPTYRSRITLPGFVSANHLFRFFNEAACLLAPSLNEPFGIIAVEAMACGTPVVAAASGGIRELINDKVGMAVAGSDVGDWTQALRSVLTGFRSPSARLRCSEHARHFNWTNITKKIEKIYIQSVSDHPRL